MAITASIIISACSNDSQAQPLTSPLRAGATPGSDVYLPMLIQDPTNMPEASTQPTLAPTSKPTTPITITNESIFGIEMENILHGGQVLADIGNTWVRRNALLWSAIEPIEGARNWSSVIGLEQELAEAARLKMKVILIIRGTPGWAQKYAGSECGPVRSNKLPAFGKFMHDVVARYSKPPFNVKHFEIWNEPDAPVATGAPVWGCWGESSDAYFGGRYYAEALKAAYPLMKAANPEAQVLVGGLLANCDPARGGKCIQSRFFEGILVAGGADFFDGLSYHTYDYYYYGSVGSYGTPNWPSSWDTTGPLLVVKGRYFKSVMQKYNVTGKYIINTELAVLCDACGTNGGGQTSNANYETTKAYYMAQGLAAAMAEDHKAITWYSLGGWFGTALWDGAKPKPALIAFGVARQKIGGADFIGEITPADVGAQGVAGYKFKRDNKEVWLVWSRNGTTKTATLNKMPSDVTDALGAGYAPARSFAITVKPVYIEFPNP